MWYNGHLGTKEIFHLSKKDLVLEMTKLSESKIKSAPLGTGCVVGKFNLETFGLRRRTAVTPVREFLWISKGPIEVQVIGEYTYFLMIVNHYPELIKSFLLVQTAQGFKLYKKVCDKGFDALNERATYAKCDNAKESPALCQESEEYLGKQGMVLDDVSDYTPELN